MARLYTRTGRMTVAHMQATMEDILIVYDMKAEARKKDEKVLRRLKLLVSQIERQIQ